MKCNNMQSLRKLQSLLHQKKMPVIYFFGGWWWNVELEFELRASHL
jgi:hypothetical protein